MSTLANIIWLVFGGIELAVSWAIAGIFCYLTIIGIPLGVQCFKMAKLSLTPFGMRVSYGGGFGSFLLNLVWLVFGIPAALCYVVIGLGWCLSIIGIPVGLQSFKMAKLSLAPFGAEVA